MPMGMLCVQIATLEFTAELLDLRISKNAIGLAKHVKRLEKSEIRTGRRRARTYSAFLPSRKPLLYPLQSALQHPFRAVIWLQNIPEMRALLSQTNSSSQQHLPKL
jgi:hypothetical protein